jgi:hypothetical protein
MTDQENLSLAFTPLDEPSARAIMRWKYDPPYDLYNVRPEENEKDRRY